MDEVKERRERSLLKVQQLDVMFVLQSTVVMLRHDMNGEIGLPVGPLRHLS